jgi:hypothetical protein
VERATVIKKEEEMDCQEGKVRKGGVNKKPRSAIAGIAMYRIFQKIRIERARQEKKWGEQNHFPPKWCLILGEEYGEVCKAALEDKFADYEKELVQVAAVAVAMLECLQKNTVKPERPTGHLITEGFPPPKCVLKKERR